MTPDDLSAQDKTDKEKSFERFGPAEELDRRVMSFLYFRFRNPVFDILMPFMSVICNKGLLHIVAGTLMILCGLHARRPDLSRAGVVLMASSGAAFFVAELPIKYFWRRKRPFMVMDEILPKVPHKRLLRRPSFPSGHASGYFAGAVALSICYPALWAVFIAVAVLGAYSRIYNGVHFPSDVMGGAVIGAIFGFAVTLLLLPLLAGAF
jgi:undecaprenyl-diphosphatase